MSYAPDTQTDADERFAPMTDVYVDVLSLIFVTQRGHS